MGLGKRFDTFMVFEGRGRAHIPCGCGASCSSQPEVGRVDATQVPTPGARGGVIHRKVKAWVGRVSPQGLGMRGTQESGGVPLLDPSL